MLNLGDKIADSAHDSAISYGARGWSVIPLRGDLDPAQPKAAAVRWADYQRRLPTGSELARWFGGGGSRALGIVCGPVSRLAVLDFDDPALAESFARALPDLAATYTVRSGGRGLPHLYFHIPPGVSLRGRRWPGADLQYEGAYVVAPPTRIAGRAWTVVRDEPARSLAAADVTRILRFFEAHAPAAAPVAVLPQTGDSAAFIAQYHALAESIGRNNALFRVACLLRDAGWTPADAADLLAERHATMPAPDGSTERADSRRAEALRTIDSAYRHAPRPPCGDQPGLANSAREWLLQTGGAALARVLDGLLLAGIKGGKWFTERAAVELLRVYGIGRRAVMDALGSPLGRLLFRVGSGARKGHGKDGSTPVDEAKQCSIVRGAKRVKTPAGRPARRYRMPHALTVCRRLGVQPGHSDPLRPADLASPSAYRQGLQRALIARRPGVYTRSWLSRRLGVSAWTCRRYDQRAGLKVTPNYRHRSIGWHNISTLPAVIGPETRAGGFLVGPDGRRYPPIQPAAARLLRYRRAITLHQQGPNHYRVQPAALYPVAISRRYIQPESAICEEIHKWIAETPVPPDPAPVLMSEMPPSVPAADPAPLTYYVCPACTRLHPTRGEPGRCQTCGGESWEVVPPDLPGDPIRFPAWWRAYRRAWRARRGLSLQPGRDLAGEVVTALGGRMARARVKALIDQHGEILVERALRLLRARHQVSDPAAFFLGALKREGDHQRARESAPPGDVYAALAGAAAADAQRLRDSAYACYYVNRGSAEC